MEPAHPEVRIHVSVGNSSVGDQADLAFRLGRLEDSALIALRLVRYRDLLVASPGYLAQCKAPGRPSDLAQHRLLTLLDRTPGQSWTFVRSDGTGQEALNVRPHMATDDTTGLIAAALADGGICTLPPTIRPDLLRDGGLVEVMPDWRLETADLYMLHLGRRHVPRPVQLFKEIAARIIPELFSDLPS